VSGSARQSSSTAASAMLALADGRAVIAGNRASSIPIGKPYNTRASPNGSRSAVDPAISRSVP
jgi:hypothetical protein